MTTMTLPFDIEKYGVPVVQSIEGTTGFIDLERGVHGIIVASSGNGKTEHCKSLAMTVLSHPISRVGIFDGKPEGAYDPFLSCLKWYVDTDEEDWLETVAAYLWDEVDDCADRRKRIRRGEKLGYDVIIMDEFQQATGNSSRGDLKKDSPQAKIRSALSELSRLGRSARKRLVFATQSYDGNIIDSDILNNIGWRIIGYCPSEMSREALGEAASVQRLDTSRMLVNGEQQGAAVVLSPGIDSYVLGRGWFQPEEDVVRFAEKIWEFREDYWAAHSSGPGAEETRDEPFPMRLARGVVAAFEDSEDGEVTTAEVMSVVVVGQLGLTEDPEDRRLVTQLGQTLRNEWMLKSRRDMRDGARVTLWDLTKMLSAAERALRR